MYNKLHPLALFRIAVLGELLTRDKLIHGELNTLYQQLASKRHRLPNGDITSISAKTIERWYYLWKKGGVDALQPQVRSDKGQSSIPKAIQEKIIALKKENPARSVNTLKTFVFQQDGMKVSRSAIYRLLKKRGLSNRSLSGSERIERRAFVAACANDIWHADVLHGPTVTLQAKTHKTYLVSMIDDASRTLMHSEFRLSEQALDIECVFKQALLKRGLPKKLIIDNGPAYRASTLKSIAARLEVQLVYCPAYEPEGKGKIERWHRTFREQFLTELRLSSITSLTELNQQLWAWIDVIYHKNPHSALRNKTPLERWQADLAKVRQLGHLAENIDAIFYHYTKRKVRKDGCISYEGLEYEVPYSAVGLQVDVVVNPEKQSVVGIQTTDGVLHEVHPLNRLANLERQRQRPKTISNQQSAVSSLTLDALNQKKKNLSLIKKEGV